MSWSTNTPLVISKGGDITLPEPALSDNVATEQNEQFTAAIEAAKVLIKAVGRDNDDVFISLAGHANPDHGPRDGWADEMVTITVSAHPV